MEKVVERLIVEEKNNDVKFHRWEVVDDQPVHFPKFGLLEDVILIEAGDGDKLVYKPGPKFYLWFQDLSKRDVDAALLEKGSRVQRMYYQMTKTLDFLYPFTKQFETIWKYAPKGEAEVLAQYNKEKLKLPLELQTYSHAREMGTFLGEMLRPGKLLNIKPLVKEGDTTLDDLAESVIQIMAMVWSQTYHRFCTGDGFESCKSTILPKCRFEWECDDADEVTCEGKGKILFPAF